MANLEQLCPGCMSEKGAVAVCPHCGWQESDQPDSPLYLRQCTVLQDRYMLGRVLGHGGFGITYLAWDKNLEIKVAVKEYLPRDLATRSIDRATISAYDDRAKTNFEYGLERFFDEAKSLTRFQQHPGIVSVSDFFKANGTAYIVMEYLEGITFECFLAQKGGKISFDTALNIMVPVMDALREVHSMGMLHRDISPDNIYITYTKQIKLLDFGAARYALGEQSQSLSMILKHGYAPREQYSKQGKQGPWTDVYAVAATIYRAVTGQTPPDAMDRLDQDTLMPPSKLGADITPQSEKVLLKALSLNASGRYQSIQEMQQAFIKQEAPVPEPEVYLANCPYCHAVNRILKDKPLANAVCGKCGKSMVKSSQPEPQTKSNSLHLWRGIAVFCVIALAVVIIVSNNYSEHADKGKETSKQTQVVEQPVQRVVEPPKKTVDPKLVEDIQFLDECAATKDVMDKNVRDLATSINNTEGNVSPKLLRQCEDVWAKAGSAYQYFTKRQMNFSETNSYRQQLAKLMEYQGMRVKAMGMGVDALLRQDASAARQHFDRGGDMMKTYDTMNETFNTDYAAFRNKSLRN